MIRELLRKAIESSDPVMTWLILGFAVGVGFIVSVGLLAISGWPDGATNWFKS